MKILKHPDTKWTYKTTCPNCTAELEVEKPDVKFSHYSGDYFREPAYDIWQANCAVCSSGITIPAENIPKAVQFEIKKKTNIGGPLDR